jgi:SdpI/YfhL protein family
MNNIFQAGNEDVWLRTHRLGGKTFLLGGVLVLASVGVGVGLCSLVAVVAALVPAVYSCFDYRRLEHRE